MPDYALNCVSAVRDLEAEIVTLKKRADQLEAVERRLKLDKAMHTIEWAADDVDDTIARISDLVSDLNFAAKRLEEEHLHRDLDLAEKAGV